MKVSLMANARQSMIDMLDRLDASSATTIEALRAERPALSEEVRTKHEGLTEAADTQRKAIALTSRAGWRACLIVHLGLRPVAFFPSGHPIAACTRTFGRQPTPRTLRHP
jgi:hypothetical protein